MNGYLWQVVYVSSDDPVLIDRTGSFTLAVTDPETLCVYVSNNLNGNLLNKVIIHELGHCAIFSFNLLDDIHRMVHPRYWIEAEEWICNFIAEYGFNIFQTAYSILDDDALYTVSKRIEKLVA